jgi:OTU domain-containing protein 6
MEELQSKHRKEQRDLQSKVTQKKKQASKKTRKGVNEECDRLEADLKQKQADEIAAFNGEPASNGDGIPVDQLDDLTLQQDDDNSEPNEPAPKQPTPTAQSNNTTEPALPSQGRKPNRQKERLARRAAEHEELAKQAAEEAKNLPDMKQQERERMLSYMKERGLQEKEIRADGHCLYSAVADQLAQLNIPLGTAPGAQAEVLPYKTTRSAAAGWIENHPEDFEPFLEEPLPEYLRKIRETGEWGGQLELLALAKSYGVEINVLQDFGRVEKIEPESDAAGKSVWLGYYKHGFGLGEHYNSLRKAG